MEKYIQRAPVINVGLQKTQFPGRFILMLKLTCLYFHIQCWHFCICYFVLPCPVFFLPVIINTLKLKIYFFFLLSDYGTRTFADTLLDSLPNETGKRKHNRKW